MDLASVPWSFVMAFASLAFVFLLHRARPDVFRDLGFGRQELALLCLGSIAGWAGNVPLAIYGGTYLAVNFGGTLVPLLLIGYWLVKRKLPLIPTLIGTALVTYTAWRIVEFRADTGIVARYPTFFLPVVVAFGFALVASLRDLRKGVYVAYASGTLGALIGADLLHVRDIGAYFGNAKESTVISIGGAGVFDMVFLAGSTALALQLAVVALLRRRARPAPAGFAYPAPPITLRDSRRVHESYLKIESPNGLERALAGIAQSNLALRDGDYARSVRMSWLAVDALLGAAALAPWIGTAEAADLKRDAETLRERYHEARQGAASLQDAGEANATAKVIVSALAPRAGLKHALEGVA